MHYMLLIYGDESVWANLSPEQISAEMGAYFAYSEDLAKAGVLLGGDELHPVATAKTISVSDGKQKVILACRGRNLRFWRAESSDAGQHFKVGTVWQPFGRPDKGRVRYDNNDRSGDLQEMFSAPAIAASDDMDDWLVLGLSPTLTVWRNKCSRGAPAVWHALNPEPEQDLRPHFY